MLLILLISITCAVIGAIIGMRHREAPCGALMGLVLGPIGVIMAALLIKE